MVLIFIPSSNGAELGDSSPLLYRSSQNKTKNIVPVKAIGNIVIVTSQNWKFLVGFSLFVIRL